MYSGRDIPSEKRTQLHWSPWSWQMWSQPQNIDISEKVRLKGLEAGVGVLLPALGP